MPDTVKHEVKGLLAKLLATEDLVVEHKKVSTAQFNVHTRVLTLPMWDRASNMVYDMLVAHEVGHALFTPDINWLLEHKVHPSIVNIVEDVRIEKLMKRKYAGLPKTFYHGYQELNDDDFFSVVDEELAELSFADRINLHFKIGLFIDIDFTDQEQEIVDKVNSCETFDEVLEASKLVQGVDLEWMKNKEEISKGELSIDVKLPSEDGSSEQSDSKADDDQEYQTRSESDSSDEDDSEESESRNQSEDSEIKQAPTTGGVHSNDMDIDIRTVGSLEQNIQDLTDEGSAENVYVEIPKVDLEKIIIRNERIQVECEEYWTYDEEAEKQYERLYGFSRSKMQNFDEIDSDYQDFKSSAKKEVNYLVKEFEMKKSADAYARSAVSKTGVLDCSKLHTFKYNEDLFKKVTTLPDGKNHGLVFILDWSGSMSHVMLDTIKQLYNLMWFCKKVQIPFEVYAFTNDHPPTHIDDDGTRSKCYEPKAGVIALPEHFSLMNFFTSKVNNKTLDLQMKYIFRIAHAVRNYSDYDIPQQLRLSGTPLNETFIALHQLLPQFKKENKVDKVQCVILTDGEGCQVGYHREVQRHWEDQPYLGTGHLHGNSFLRDRKIGRTYNFTGSWSGISPVFLNNLRDKFTDVNFIGIRLIGNRDAQYFIRQNIGYGDDAEKYSRMFKKDKSVALEDVGYSVYFGLSAKSLANNSEFSVQDDATKAQIKRAFSKSLSAKKFNKKVLSKFMEFVA
tara:strand:- start:537 stop:2735 length:2199 start_codon:yes stop_codon:yes gene_type:complete